MASLMDILRQAGFRGNGLKMAYAIAMAESSGNAHAHNPNAGTGDNSYGLFQINMLGAMGPERRARYGLSSNEDLYDPLTNARIAYKMSRGGTHWTDWSTYNHGQYKAYYGGSQGATVTNTSGVYSVGGTATPKLSMEDMAARYGLAAEVLKQNKQIRDLVKQAVKEGWDQALFTAHLKNTKWWRTTTDAQRKYFFLRTSDPATFKQKWSSYQFSLNQLAVQVGLGSQINKKGQSSKLLQNAINYKMRDGWSDARIKAYLGQSVGMHGNEMWGDAGTAYNQIFSLAYQNGQSFSKGWYQTNIRNVVSGKTSLEALEAQIRNQAASKYYAFANQIRAGQNVLDLAQPYISAVSQILELPQTDIDLHNKFINKAMTSKVAAGQQPGTQYPLWQFENDLRNDPLWKKTNNARESMFSVAHQVAKDFGMAF